MINLLNIEPHKVSTDLSGYITFIYGGYKTGKTTLASEMDSALLLAFEHGYSAIPGIRAQEVTSWIVMKEIYRELKKPEVKNFYKAIVVDTIDVAADMCKTYICTQNNISDLGDLGYGKGWTKFKDEFNNIFRGLTQMGYAVYFIGHDKEAKDNNGNITNIRPAISNSVREVIAGMADIYGYARQSGPGKNSVLMLRDPSGFVECGCRFKYVPEVIPMNYNSLTKAIHEAIDKEAAENGGKFLTDKAQVIEEMPTYDFEELMNEFNNIKDKLMANDPNKYGPRLVEIIARYFGENKISNAVPTQAQLVNSVVQDIKAELL